MFKLHNPYMANYTVKIPPETINAERSQADSKSVARYPDKPQSNIPGGSTKTSGPFRRAMTPGTSPTGS